MISGFSNMQGGGGNGHAFSGANSLPVPFNIPKVLEALLDPDTALQFTAKQEDMITALRFAHHARAKMLQRLAQEESRLKALMLEGDLIAKARYDDIMLEKLQGFEHYLELIEGVASLLEPEQYKQLLASVNITQD